jgi:tetratricopeptide (TPR) repeat protein
VQHREGNTAQALETLERAWRQAPRDPRPLDEKAQILVDSGRHDEAVAVVEQALQTIPDSVQTYEWAIARLRQCGRPAAAVEAARQGTRAYPRGAYLWLLLGRTLREQPEFAAPGELEACLRRSLRSNATLYESADWLAVLLVEQHRYDEAAALLRDVEPTMPDPSAARGRLAWIRRQHKSRRGEPEAALADLAEAVALAPWYSWGWNRLLGWLGEDKDWGRAKTLLATVPPTLLGDLDFRQKRLEVLDRAGADKSITESEWESLLSESPDDVVLHMRRFDALQKAARMPEAAVVVRRVLPAAQDNVYLRARLVHVDCFEQNREAALEDALLISFAKLEESEWPADQVWGAMRKAGFLDDFVRGFRDRLKQADQPTPRSLSLYAQQLLDRGTQHQLGKWFDRSWLNPATLRLYWFLRLVERSAWVESAHIAILMEALNLSGRRRMVVMCWRHLRARGWETNTAAWAQAGSALVTLRKMHTARKLLADWRTRTAVQMWMVANYVVALPRFTKAGRNEVAATCREGLSTLAHDHSARFLAYMGAEACVLNRDTQGLLTLWNDYSRYFDGNPTAEEFFPQWQRYLMADIPVAVRRASEPAGKGLGSLRLKLCTGRLWNTNTRARARWIFVFLIRVLLVAMASGGALSHLFR